MGNLEILCVTMHQKDFSKIQQMNIHSDVFFANQADRTALEEMEFEGHKARMLTTETRGVGINRNMTLQYAQGDICLFADDDITYCDDMEQKVLSEFDAHPDADIMIFHLDTDSSRKQISYPKTKKCGRFDRMPWGAVRIAFRRSSWQKSNVWFTTLFGGGAVFPSGEDSIWLTEARRKGMTFYVSKETIGKIDMEESSWFTGRDEKYFFARGVFYAATHPKTQWIWRWYAAFSVRANCNLSVGEKIKWMKLGREGYNTMQGYGSFLKG